MAVAAWGIVGSPLPLSAQIDIEEPPIEYSDTEDDNAVRDLRDRIESGDVSLRYERGRGYLKALLDELNIPVSSQVLVFSKTSMQVRYISPRNPRAIYFNDDIYVGWVRGSSLMEISTCDPNLGAAFYTIDMTPLRVDIERANYDCLACHTTTLTQGVPGHTVRSVHPRIDGSIDARKDSFLTDHTSPLSERWGGWYVTGRHGATPHMGNSFLQGDRLVRRGESERLSLREDFQTDDWLSPYSDIVSLMVLEHQTQMQNVFTKANFTVRKARYDYNQARERAGGQEAGEERPLGEEEEAELAHVIKQAAAEVVDYLLFVDEARLTSPVTGSVVFASEFRERGPADHQGRSLRDFDLQTRLFRYPCSYQIHSTAFDSLDDRLKQAIYRRLAVVLAGDSRERRYDFLTDQTRQAIREILSETKPEVVPYFGNPS